MRKATRPDAVPLNLVSMIDVFTTLVFFLMLTSTNAQTLPTPKSLELPHSLSMQPPEDSAVVTITHDQILFQGAAVMTVAAASAVTGDNLPALKAQLLKIEKTTHGSTDGKLSRGQINVMADKDIPFGLLKKVMATCGGSADFSKISLSVRHSGRGA
jgi:biopolymer transport protein ExbD